MNNTKEKHSRKYYQELDKLVLKESKKENIRERKQVFIPLTRDFAFKTIMFKNTDLLKKFIVNTTDIDLSPNEINLVLLDKELIKHNFREKGKIADMVVKIKDNLILDIEVNSKPYEIVKNRNDRYLDKLATLQVEVGDDYTGYNNMLLYQINLNASVEEDGDIEPDEAQMMWKRKNIPFSNNKKIYSKYLVYYYKKYYNGDKLSDDEIFMAALMSKNYTELYDIMSNILSINKLDKFMKDVIDMGSWPKDFSLHEWGKEYLDKMEAYDEMVYYENKTIEKTIKNLLIKNMSYEDISDVTGKSISDIKKIEESMNEE